MDPRILFVSTYPALTSAARELSSRVGVPMDISEGGILSDGHLYAKSVEENYDVVVSQGATALSIGAVVKIPVVAIRITVGDFLRAFEKARKYGDPLAIICYRGELEDELRLVAEVFSDVPYTIYVYSNKDEFISQTTSVFSLKGYTVMGFGSCAQVLARQSGLNYILIKSRIENIRNAMLTAKNIVDVSKKEKIESRRLRSLIYYSNEGILSCDKHLVVTAFNASAERILHLNSRNIIGKNIKDSAVPPILRKLYEDGSFVVNKLMRFNGNSLVLNRVPLDVNNEFEESIITFQDVSYIQKLETTTRMQLHDKGLVARHTFANIVGSSEQIRSTVEKARRFSTSSVSVLIEGETGTGKELFAHSIHNASMRAMGPFVAINCAALPETLLESELFGYDTGAFTGAKKGGKSGLFELAHNGTIFLDEIGEISPSLQNRLLRVLQEKEILRVGGDRIVNVNVRVVAATNKNLYRMVQDGLFRRDLYFRINLLNLFIPSLLTRKQDIRDLADHFVEVKNAAHNKHMPLIPEKSMALLQAYSWPGNIRELEFFIEKLVVLHDEHCDLNQFVSGTIREHVAMHDETLDEPTPGGEDETITIKVSQMKDMQSQIIESLLDRAGGNKGQLAKDLGISRTTVWKKLVESRNSLS